MIYILNTDCATGRSPCYECEKHKKGIPPIICSVNCKKLAEYRRCPEPVPLRKEVRKKYTTKLPKEPKKCCVDGCVADVRTWDLCSRHYYQWKGGKKLRLHPKTGVLHIDRNSEGNCCLPGCKRRAKAHDLCSKDYMAWQRGKSLVYHPTTGKKYADREMRSLSGGECYTDGCHKKAVARGLCRACYYAWKRGTMEFHPVTCKRYNRIKRRKHVK